MIQLLRFLSLPIAITMAVTGNASIALATTRIEFASNSYCGAYAGDFSRGREFVLNIGSGQTLTLRNIGNGTQYTAYVSGPNGQIYGDQVEFDQVNYWIPETGDYYIYIQSSTGYNAVEFCAY
ncbi:hypothetical protein [Thermocoleostomius sinensis]|jgi:hypothetical protein|uniref:Uncharacterized protein n=1 Tax=Thermocoleostomius sinensis A174 TaxID=2016057 RepID=A0A9E8ZDQ0_9CYAN|nr:hypothetical protein [Thermocoleostomius sinensis]WAL61420.1 hypothetical protein OXH18_05365 [Thermocoleostomius sinensis A174]